ncbi:MAG: hypothetical protein HQK79_05710 [Desulfobacterales bacterium]|nr:hypothetical protein [Desulfobacterales bacterium]
MSFNSLIETIQQTHLSFQEQVVKAVNIGLPIRNWLIGFYIVEFEQNGDDKAKYGTALLSNIAKNIAIKGLTAPELSRCRQFYTVYPEILGSVTQTLTANFIGNKTQQLLASRILGLATQDNEIFKKNKRMDSYYIYFIKIMI